MEKEGEHLVKSFLTGSWCASKNNFYIGVIHYDQKCSESDIKFVLERDITYAFIMDQGGELDEWRKIQGFYQKKPMQL